MGFTAPTTIAGVIGEVTDGLAALDMTIVPWAALVLSFVYGLVRQFTKKRA